MIYEKALNWGDSRVARRGFTSGLAARAGEAQHMTLFQFSLYISLFTPLSQGPSVVANVTESRFRSRLRRLSC